MTAVTSPGGRIAETSPTRTACSLKPSVALTRRATAYLRAEIVETHILEAGALHPPGLQHPHVLSTVKALTIGYQHRLLTSRTAGALYAGADVTAHATPDNLRDSYGEAVSIHLYGRCTLRYPVRPVKEDR